ncbi:ATP-binding protein [Pseudobutyrivibrio xylanivorans]|uniref:AAA family ATPase n=1 Tax=Pseudobutyrivibrio xylanivorans TaxID=185007 RepID=A0A5P6VVL0_PSEXY|nr:ATP-binding protein [Pseudobutyrivibrio xylanivorans]QFJ56099.1 AAA family ATPase [Pseudobutyrivibrio xylanivorans]
MILEELVNGLLIESSKYECKSKLNREDVLGWLKTIAGFANAEGGNFYIGVEDKSNRLIGFDREDVDNERNYFNNQVNEHLIPRPELHISFLQYKVKDKERYIIQVNVPESKVKPVVLKYKGIPSIFMRRDGFTNGATYEEIIEMSIKSKNTQYDVLYSDEEYDPNNFQQLQDFCAKHNEKNPHITDKAFKSMGFFDENNKLSNGATLFADGYDGDKTQVQCSLFSGFNKGSERIITINRYCGNITSVIEYILEFVHQRMNRSIKKLGDGRINIDAYPERALFEGVINAVAHRDYYLDGTQIQVDMFKDRLEISSPGGFYHGEKMGKTYDLSQIISKRRNEIISSVLVRCNVMEAAGTGFDKIIEEYEGEDDLHKPYICSSSDHFTLVLPDLTYEGGIDNSENPIVEFVPVPNGTSYDAQVLSFCYYKARKVAEIAEVLGISDSTYLRKNILGNMVDTGYLIFNKEGRASYYKTNPEMVRV